MQELLPLHLLPPAHPLSLPHCIPISMPNMAATLENLTTFGISSTFKKDIYRAKSNVLVFTGEKTPKTQKTSTGLSFEKDP